MKLRVVTSFNIPKQEEVEETFNFSIAQAKEIISDQLNKLSYKDRKKFLAKYGITA